MLLEDYINIARTYQLDISSCPQWIKDSYKELETYKEYSLVDGRVTYGEHNETYHRLLFAVNSFYASNENMVEKYKPYIIKSLFQREKENLYTESPTIQVW